MPIILGITLVLGFVIGYAVRSSDKSAKLLEGPTHTYAVIALRSPTEAMMITPNDLVEGESDVLLVQAAADRLVVTQVTPDRIQDVACRLCRAEFSANELSRIERFVKKYRDDIIRQGVGELKYELTTLDARVERL